MERKKIDIALIMSTQRSGTTALRSMVGQSPDIINMGEILSGKSDPAAGRAVISGGLLYYLAAEIRKEQNFCFRPSEMEGIFDRYFSASHSQSPAVRFALIDCKYNSLSVFNPSGWTPLKIPFFLHLCRKNNAKIIHLVRQNVFETYLSALRVRATKEWHHPTNSALEPKSELKSVRVDVSRLEWELTRRLSEISYFRSLFVEYSNYIEISYEKMFSKGGRNQEIQTVEGLLDVKLDGNEPRFEKIIHDWRSFVENYDQVCDVVYASSYLRGKLSSYFR